MLWTGPMKRALILVLVVVVVGAAFGVWYYLIRDDTPPPAALPDRPTDTTTDAGGGAGDGTGGDDATDPVGPWSVATGDETFAGFRITENFTGGIDNTAVMHSPAVTGTLTVDGTEISEVTVEVDLSALESKDSVPPGVPGIENRVGQMRGDGLEIDTYPTASFELTEPIALNGEPTLGQEVAAEATGDLTVHGETRTVTIPIEARWSGELIDVAGSLKLALADFGMTPPERPFVSVADSGTLEFQLAFERAG